MVSLSTVTTRTGGAELEQKLQNLQEAHEILENRFKRSMKEVAELSDEKQQLEHVVQQLQLETESIGMYMIFSDGISGLDQIEKYQLCPASLVS